MRQKRSKHCELINWQYPVGPLSVPPTYNDELIAQIAHLSHCSESDEY